jgi:hypothetical protein
LKADKLSMARELISEGRWMSRAEMAGQTVYPSLLQDRFWTDLEQGFPETRILEMRTMDAE